MKSGGPRWARRAPCRTPGRALLGLILLSSAPCLSHGLPGQTVEPVFDPFASGAVTTIDLDETALGAVDLVEVMKWYVPGLQVQGIPGGQVQILLRAGAGPPSSGGSSPRLSGPPNPLLIIDGIPVANQDFSWELRSLNPSMVARVQVLRDIASTSVYGIRGERGVILVFTRRRPDAGPR